MNAPDNSNSGPLRQVPERVACASQLITLSGNDLANTICRDASAR